MYVVTFDPRPVTGPGAIGGLRRMTLREARDVLTLAASIPKRGRIVDAETLEVTSPVDPGTVRDGDVITWTARNGGHQASGKVAWTVSTGAYVTIPDRGTYLVEWPRVESVASAHTHPRGVICSPAWCGSAGPNASVLDK